MQCKKCSSKHYVKAGFVRKKQRYKCQDCGCHFTDTTQGVSIEVKRLAIQLYLEGVGFRGIGRLVGVSNVAVLKWVRKLSKTIEECRKGCSEEKEVYIMELDEMWHYIGEKNEKHGSGWLLLETVKSLIGQSVVVGRKQEESSGIKLNKRQKNMLQITGNHT